MCMLWDGQLGATCKRLMSRAVCIGHYTAEFTAIEHWPCIKQTLNVCQEVTYPLCVALLGTTCPWISTIEFDAL